MKGFMSKIHPGVLDETQRSVFSRLAAFKGYGYLAGGTALALQIAHRRSFDFDVFVKSSINKSLRRKVRDIFGIVDFYVDTSDQISFKTYNNSAVTFVWYYYSLLDHPVRTDSINLASVHDIAADKAHTIGRRAVWRDYVDLFFLLKKGLITLEYLCKLASKKFGGEFNEALFLEQLCYFKDIAEVPIEFLKKSYTPGQIQTFLQKEVRGYLTRILP